MENTEKRQLHFIIGSITSLILIGTIGYRYLLDVSLIDALYMTIITISTVGYREVAVMSDSARLFSIIIILWGLATVGYTFTTLIVMIVEGKISNMWRNRIVEKKISSLENHYIICGSKGSAESTIKQMIKENKVFVVVEEDLEQYTKLIAAGILSVQGESTEVEVLQRANLKNALGLIAATNSDTTNILTVLTARYMSSKLFIISEALSNDAIGKLKRAGANNTVSSAEIGGKRMASIMTRPSVISFLDVTTKAGGIELDLEDVQVNQNSEAIGKSLKELRITRRTGLTVLAVRKMNEKNLHFNPDPDRTFQEGDIMLVLGTALQVKQLREIANDNGNRLPKIK